MSGFLSRWSGRKAEARKPEPEPEGLPEVLPEEAAPLEAPDLPPEDLAEKLAALPKLEEITSATDIRPFLQDFVPRALKNAALRRAWSADPIISTHLDVARDYAWEFNAGPLPVGFSASLPSEVVERALQAVDLSQPPAEPAAAEAEIPDDSAQELPHPAEDAPVPPPFAEILPKDASEGRDAPAQAEHPLVKRLQPVKKNGAALPD